MPLWLTLLSCAGPSITKLLTAVHVDVDCTESQLTELVAALRAGDDRLVMPSPSAGTAAKQEELVNSGALGVLECAMDPLRGPEIHALGADLAHMLTTNNPKNRAAIGKLPGVLSQLAALVHNSVQVDTCDDAVVRAAENAAEAIWILAYANGASNHAAADNHKAFEGAHVAGDLAMMLEQDGAAMTPKARMWAGAALGNLMAKYDNPAATGHTGRVRDAMAGRPNFVKRLVALVRSGTVQADTPTQKMPGTARRTEEARTFGHIHGWGVMQAIKNLVLCDSGRDQLVAEPGARDLFCELKQSPDWLERVKADAIVATAFGSCGGSGVS